MDKSTYRIFVINPGSTSTKLALYEDDRKVFSENVFHDSKELLAAVRAITRSGNEVDTRMSFGNITLDRASFELSGPAGEHPAYRHLCAASRSIPGDCLHYHDHECNRY